MLEIFKDLLTILGILQVVRWITQFAAGILGGLSSYYPKQKFSTLSTTTKPNRRKYKTKKRKK